MRRRPFGPERQVVLTDPVRQGPRICETLQRCNSPKPQDLDLPGIGKLSPVLVAHRPDGLRGRGSQPEPSRARGSESRTATPAPGPPSIRYGHPPMRAIALTAAMALAAPPDNTPSKTPPAEKPACERKDFDSFDDFVDCQVASQPPAPKPAPRPASVPRHPTPPKPELPPKISGRKQRELDALEATQARYESVFLGTLIPGIILSLGGGTMTIIGLGQREPASRDDGGPNCTIGKRCGDTCIEVSDTCSVGGGAPLGPLTTRGRKITAIGGAILVTGVALLITSVVFKRWSSDIQFDIDRIRF
jgi:hypothetical protein